MAISYTSKMIIFELYFFISDVSTVSVCLASCIHCQDYVKSCWTQKHMGRGKGDIQLYPKFYKTQKRWVLILNFDSKNKMF